MRVVFLNYNIFGIGGTVRTTVNLANQLSRSGVDVSVISVRRTSRAPVLELDEDIGITTLMDVRSTKTKGGSLRAVGRRLDARTGSLLIQRDEDLYRNFSWLSDARLAFAVATLRDCVLVTTTPSFTLLALRLVHQSVTLVGQEHKVFEAHSPTLRARIRAAYPRLRGLQCVTERAAQHYSKILPSPEDGGPSVRFIPNGTPPIHSDDGVADQPERENLIVAAGHLVANKGMDRVVRAFAAVASKYPAWRLEIHGQGHEREPLRELVLELGVHNQVFLCGQARDLPSVLARSKVYALGSEYESFGMVIIEAASLQVPTIAYRSSGPEHLIHHGVTGALVDQGDEGSFAQWLDTLMGDEGRRRRLGEAAWQRAQAYQSTVVAEAWLSWTRGLHTGGVADL